MKMWSDNELTMRIGLLQSQSSFRIRVMVFGEDVARIALANALYVRIDRIKVCDLTALES